MTKGELSDEKGNKMSRVMHSAWSSFIKTGDPSRGWEKYTPAARRAMCFSAEGIVFRDIDRVEEMLWIDGLLK